MPEYTALLIEDFEDFRHAVLLTLQQSAKFQAIYQTSDGLEGVQLAEELQPDLILLDIGLPRLNGLEAARRIREVSPNSKILFLTQESSAEVVQEAVGLGAQGYLLKIDAGDDLLLAVETVLRGERFVSRDLELKGKTNARHHEILFCSDDAVLLDGLVRFVAAALSSGNGAIVWATESHREGLRQRLHGEGVNVDAVIRPGTYISSDVSEPPDRQRILAAIEAANEAAFKAGKKHPRVAVCGERAGRLWAEGKMEDALRLEQLLNELAESHDIDILCVYPWPQSQEQDAFKSLCAEHTVVDFH
jgi:DNA-binding NarL/FixJ family response regulator